MSTLDFVSSQGEKKKKNINLKTFTAITFFILALGSILFVSLKYWDKNRKEELLRSLEMEQNTPKYKEAKAFYQIEKDLKNIEKNTLPLGTILSDIYEKTIDGVVYESVNYSAKRDGGGEVKLKGIFSDIYLIDEQVKKYQKVEGEPLVTYTLEGDSTGKKESLNSQAAVIYLQF